MVSLTGSAMATIAGDLTVDADEDGGGAVGAEPISLDAVSGAGVDAVVEQEGGAADHDAAVLDGADDALAGGGVEVAHLRDDQTGAGRPR